MTIVESDGRLAIDGATLDEMPRACDRCGIGGAMVGGESPIGLGTLSMPLTLGLTGKRPPVTPRLGGRGVSTLVSLWTSQDSL